MTQAQKALFMRYCPHILKDTADPFPIRFIGCTAFPVPRRSASFPKWHIDPKIQAKLDAEAAAQAQKPDDQ